MTTHQVRFLGGPLDGRVQPLGGEPVCGSILRHVHLHEGPKIETYYQLGYTDVTGWTYRLYGRPAPEEIAGTASADEVGER
ncbi:hypothetical protein B0I33_11433 [Prauserella shujinwangii]|uniref:Uncharacterized protein n=1 Tax=Prauserella shujinwangii TaxID=1453103 RepID=A0A2T0LL10_9PSEU|nr:hypothetical protein [Prauserella shujinwangii]PRX43574.1 hypothetical protein B0I33_11433 [Prauserella shujinwangii]